MSSLPNRRTADAFQSRMFYFTEVDGRIYSVTTTSSPDATDRLSDETEKVINSLQNGARRKVQRAALQE